MIEQTFITFYRQLNNAMVKADIATLEQILTTDFTLTHMTGYQQSREEWLEHIATGQMRYFKTEEVSVKTHGNQVIGQAITTADIWGIQGTWNLQITLTLQQTDGNWKIKKAVATTF